MISEKLSHDPINSEDVLELYRKYPQQLVTILSSRNIHLTGCVSRLFVGGTDNDRADITLSQHGPYKIVLSCDLKSTRRGVELNPNPAYHHKFDSINGQLLFTSWKPEHTNYRQGYHQYPPYPYDYYGAHVWGKHEDADSKTTLVCSERSNINPFWARLKNNNTYSLIFEADSPIIK